MEKMNVGTRWGYWGGVCTLILALFGLAGCATAPEDEFAVVPGMEQVKHMPDPSAGEQEQERGVASIISTADVLLITFTDTPTPIQPLEVKVQDDGTIKLYYNEIFKADGLTTTQLEQEIQQRYVPKYFTRLTVMVNHQGATRYYFVDGEVRQPGQKPYVGRITVTQAISASSGFTDFANKTKVRLIRANGKIEYVNAKKALKDPKLDRWVYPNDKIYVKRTIW